MSTIIKNVVIYSKNLCPYCDMAKDLLKRNNITFKEINLTSSPTVIQEMLDKSNGKKTVPQVFFGNRHIGGYDDLCKFFKKNNI